MADSGKGPCVPRVGWWHKGSPKLPQPSVTSQEENLLKNDITRGKGGGASLMMSLGLLDPTVPETEHLDLSVP